MIVKRGDLYVGLGRANYGLYKNESGVYDKEFTIYASVFFCSNHMYKIYLDSKLIEVCRDNIVTSADLKRYKTA